MPDNSHFHLDVLCSFVSFERYQEPQWGYNVFKTYVLLREGSSIEALQDKLDDIVKNHMFDTKEIGIRKILGASVPGIILMMSREYTR